MNKSDLNQTSNLLENKLHPIHDELKKHGQELKKHGKLLESLKRDQDTVLDMLDKEQMEQRKRLARVEEHLDINTVD